jgi:hypothetical protein
MPDTRPLEVTVGHPAREEESLSLSLSLVPFAWQVRSHANKWRSNEIVAVVRGGARARSARAVKAA